MNCDLLPIAPTSCPTIGNTLVEPTPPVKIFDIYNNDLCHSLKLYSHAKKNEYSKVTLSAEAQSCLQQLHNTLLAKQYSVRTIRNYTQEMRFLFAHYNDLLPSAITQQDIINYISFIIREHGVGREKCHQVAQSCSFYYKHVYPSAFIVPSAFYPRKKNKLPQVFSVAAVQQLLSVISNQKHKMIVSLFYGCGLRMNELRNLRSGDIDSKSFQLKVVVAKGGRERFTLLPKNILEPLRDYYRSYRPKVYLFEGQRAGSPMHERSIQHFMQLGGVALVIEYLGRYTHKTAITKYRISSISATGVSFKYKDYADGSKQKEMQLSTAEFIRRFEQHFLPHRFVKIRHYGFLKNYNKTARLNAVRLTMDLKPLKVPVQIPVAQRMLETYGQDITLCPKCRTGKLMLVAIVYPGMGESLYHPQRQHTAEAEVCNKAGP